jgi:hypothetical protein
MRSAIPAAMLRAAAALLVAPVPGASAADDLCGQPKATPEALYEQLSKDSRLREMRRSDLYVALENGTDGTLWTFTLPAHPAHPAVVCRRVMERRGTIEIPTTIECKGAQAACDKLKSDFDLLNERMVQDLYQQKR